jgi:hypothetical protein
MKYLKLYETFKFTGNDFISCDIQPEYEKYFSFKIYKYIDFLNKNHENFNSITLLYNGYDTLGMISEDDYKNWLLENGLEEDVLDKIRCFDKGYAFFRFPLDYGINDEMIIALIKYLYVNNINDSRDIDEDAWNEIEEFYGEEISLKAIRSLLENCEDSINIPDLMDFLKEFNSGNIVLTGGGMNECLKEVELALNALELKYELYNEFVY